MYLKLYIGIFGYNIYTKIVGSK